MLALKFTGPVSDSCVLPKEELHGKTLPKSGLEHEGYYRQSYSVQCVTDNVHNTIKFGHLMKISLPGNGPMFPKMRVKILWRITTSEQEALNLAIETCNGILRFLRCGIPVVLGQ